MENNKNKISTSIQYQISNNWLFDEVFANWRNFNEVLRKGPNEMKKYLVEAWNMLKEELKANDNLIIKDLDKEVTVDDFDVTYNRTNNGISVFYITFPDYEYTDAASKYVALALTPNMPKYMTLEYSENVNDGSACWVIGEFKIENNKKVHVNYGSIDNMRLSWFAGYVMGKIEAEKFN